VQILPNTGNIEAVRKAADIGLTRFVNDAKRMLE